MTSNKEDYLKVIFEEGGLDKPVPNKVIAEKLAIAAPSVSEMLAKLHQQGLIVYAAYKGSRLTAQGLATCIDVVRSHRLWEVFLMRYLGYSWREAHEDAHLLEHISPERLVDRLDTFLGYPQTCPHGALIPHKGQHIDDPRQERLSNLSAGDVVMVCRIAEDGWLLDYLERRGLKVQEVIEMLSIDDYEGPVTFLQDGKTISISFKAATQIYVQRCYHKFEAEAD